MVRVILLPLLWGVFGQGDLFAQEDPGPPVIKKGPNAPRKKVEDPKEAKVPLGLRLEDQMATQPGLASAANYPGRAALLLQAYEVAMEYSATLPNFACDQKATRFKSNSKPEKWNKQDTIDVEVLYVDGKEDYRNYQRNGKPMKEGSPIDSGSWSYGDWASTLLEVLHPGNEGKFTLREEGKNQEVIEGITAVIYNFSVTQPKSQWQIRFGETVKPAYTGSIWIDPESGRTLRIERQSRRLPADYGIDLVEMSLDYGWVTIAEQRYLLPVRSSNLACATASVKCSRNDLVYTNYRKFSAESTISTTESSISFGETEPAPKVPPKKN